MARFKWLLAVIPILVVGGIALFSNQGDSYFCPGTRTPRANGCGTSSSDSFSSIDSSTSSSFWLWALLIIAIVAAFFLVRYVDKVAAKTGRSRLGFALLGIFMPPVAWAICLVLDKDDSRINATKSIN